VKNVLTDGQLRIPALTTPCCAGVFVFFASERGLRTCGARLGAGGRALLYHESYQYHSSSETWPTCVFVCSFSMSLCNSRRGCSPDCVVIRTHDRWQKKKKMKPLSDANDVQCTVSDRKQCRCQHAESMNRTCSTEPPVLVYALS